jgi:hypothetical protein
LLVECMKSRSDERVAQLPDLGRLSRFHSVSARRSLRRGAPPRTQSEFRLVILLRTSVETVADRPLCPPQFTPSYIRLKRNK